MQTSLSHDMSLFISLYRINYQNPQFNKVVLEMIFIFRIHMKAMLFVIQVEGSSIIK
jgi:hypothetical protein